jgi:large subunit ribosomal protein L15
MPLYRRVPKRGFNNVNRVEYQVVNVEVLAGLGAERVTLELLREKRLVQGDRPVKLLGGGSIDKPVFVVCHAFSKSAKEKIEAAGGKLEVLA